MTPRRRPKHLHSVPALERTASGCPPWCIVEHPATQGPLQHRSSNVGLVTTDDDTKTKITAAFAREDSGAGNIGPTYLAYFANDVDEIDAVDEDIRDMVEVELITLLSYRYPSH